MNSIITPEKPRRPFWSVVVDAFAAAVCLMFAALAIGFALGVVHIMFGRL